MRASKLKTVLKNEMLINFYSQWSQGDIDAQEEFMSEVMGIERPLTKTQIARFMSVIESIVDQALDKVGYQ
jgi:hypothetical protein